MSVAEQQQNIPHNCGLFFPQKYSRSKSGVCRTDKKKSHGPTTIELTRSWLLHIKCRPERTSFSSVWHFFLHLRCRALCSKIPWPSSETSIILYSRPRFRRLQSPCGY